MAKEIPIANWHETTKSGGIGKVIQVYVDDKPYLRFRQHDENIPHGEILKDFLNEIKVPFETTMGGGPKREKSLPAPTGQRYRLVGMGYYILTRVGGFHIIPPDNKNDYNMGIDKKHLEEIVRLSS